MDTIFCAKISKGKVEVKEDHRFRLFLKKFEGKIVELIIRSVRSKRTLSQNRFYHGVIIPMFSDYWGLSDPEEACFLLRKKFLKYAKMIRGKEEVFIRSTADLKSNEMADYLMKVQRFGETECGLIVPDREMFEEYERELYQLSEKK
jgi:hypothetical protein